MKKILFSLLFLLSVLSVDAQINRTILGISLGSTYDNTIALLKKAGAEIEVKQGKDNNRTIVATSPLLFDVEWEAVYIKLYNNKVCSFTFGKKYSSLSYDFFEKELTNVNATLNYLYGSFINKSVGTDTFVEYRDDRTIVGLSFLLEDNFLFGGEDALFVVSYSDKEIATKIGINHDKLVDEFYDFYF